MKRYNIKKDCVINHQFYQCGTVFTDDKEKGDKTYIQVLIDNGFMTELIEKPKTIWDLEDGDKCYCINANPYNVYAEQFLWSNYYRGDREVGGVFLTELECNKEIARRKAKVILEGDTNGFKPDWKDAQQRRYHVHYNIQTHELNADYWKYRNYGSIYFDSMEEAEESMKKHRREWLTYLGVEE